MDAPLQGAAPTRLHQIMRCAITHCTFDSSKPHGVPLPHRGYTFDSAGLASATQPTLGNNAREEATPLGVVLFKINFRMKKSFANNPFAACGNDVR